MLDRETSAKMREQKLRSDDCLKTEHTHIQRQKEKEREGKEGKTAAHTALKIIRHTVD